MTGEGEALSDNVLEAMESERVATRDADLAATVATLRKPAHDAADMTAQPLQTRGVTIDTLHALAARGE